MKKPSLTIYTIILAFFLIVQTNAQELYFRAGSGFVVESGKTEFNNADPNGLTQIEQSTNITVNPNGTVKIESLNGTLGAGIKFNLTAGYMFNKNVGL